VDATTHLKNACSQLYNVVDVNASLSEADRAKTIVALAKTVLVSTHKLSFIGDTILKNLIPGPLRTRIQQRCVELCRADNIKAVVAYAKIAAVVDPRSPSPVEARQRLAETAKDILLTAIAFADIIARPR